MNSWQFLSAVLSIKYSHLHHILKALKLSKLYYFHFIVIFKISKWENTQNRIPLLFSSELPILHTISKCVNTMVRPSYTRIPCAPIKVPRAPRSLLHQGRSLLHQCLSCTKVSLAPRFFVHQGNSCTTVPLALWPLLHHGTLEPRSLLHLG